ncbi:hypothetical protein [Streptomyces sp. NPDC018031]|uniref:hypothetical protein n=1 Tax=Streptomyces sp. NPDC018031 TaxID=3365033 RepID=UPI0037A28AF4
MSAQEPPAAPVRRDEQPSMRDLLASCAAANAVSTPPRTAPEETAEPAERDERAPGTAVTPDRDAA